ncbi:LemA family protein [Anaerococcus sp. Marseille-Q5996]|uniref:LemA family protein n=1 Tax=Anaerococcus sp. Marseille-Q5996 TaxID=2972769 RepID=UPI0021C9547F|nr:LemA family protein [Anaerococcus sp. Marseille-Q5996]
MGYIILIIVVLIVLAIVGVYNSLVRKNEMVANAMNQIGTQLQSRWDALNNLIDATKDYAKYESETLDKITKNRTGVNKNSSPADVSREENEFKSALNQFYAVAENYPDLKSSQVYKSTMDSINKYEDNVRHSRMIYNDTVTSFNRYIKSFPQNLFAGMFGYGEKDYFKNEEVSNQAPKWNS